MNKLIFEGQLFNSCSNYLVIVSNGKSVELDDTLMRSQFLGRHVNITVELGKDDEINDMCSV